MQADWPLTGRAGELRSLWSLVSDRGSRGVLLAGPAGVGKTRLAQECLQMAEQAGLATARVTATRSAAGLPFGALAPLLPAVHGDEARAVDDRADLLRRSAAALLESAANRRLILVIDDAHLLDDASATLVHQLSLTGAAFVLATLRTGEPAPDPVVALWKDGVAQRVELAGLNSEAIEELLSSALGGAVDRAAVAHLAVRCQGNVLFLRELVLGARQDGTLRDEDGIWRLVGPLSPSDRLVELVEARLAGLAGVERDLLEVASFGEPLGRAELDALSDPGSAERLERQGLLFTRIVGRRLEVRLAHPIYGDVLRARLPAVRAAEVARFLAEVVEGAGVRRREDPLRVGTWRLDGGGGRPDVMLAAATTARWSYDFPLADRLARAAVQAGAGFEAALLSAQLACLGGRNREAEIELASLADAAGDDAQRGLVALIRLDNGAFYLGRMDEALRVAQEAEATITDPAWRDEVTARRSAILLATKGPSAAREVAEPLLHRAEGRALVWAALPAAYSLARLGRIEAALSASEQGYRAHLALAEPMPWYPWFQLFARCETLAHAGRFEDAEVLATAQYQQALAEQSTEAQAHFAWHLAKTVGDRGHVRAAVRLAREAVALFRALGRPTFVQNSLISLATALALGRQPQEAAQALQSLADLGLPPGLWTAVELAEARAWTAAAADDLPGARRLLEEGVTLGEEIGDLVRAAAALHGLARLGRAREVTCRLADLAAELEGVLPAARVAHARFLAERDPENLEEVSISFEGMGAHLLAAEAAADAAVLWRSSNDARHATSANRRAATLAARCEDAATPALRAIEVRARLTPAERETALLAAAGRSSKEIAGKLSLSVRTVENRLQRVYDKLGVSSRAELVRSLENA